jgi:hypothetical protein
MHGAFRSVHARGHSRKYQHGRAENGEVNADGSKNLQLARGERLPDEATKCIGVLRDACARGVSCTRTTHPNTCVWSSKFAVARIAHALDSFYGYVNSFFSWHTHENTQNTQKNITQFTCYQHP